MTGTPRERNTSPNSFPFCGLSIALVRAVAMRLLAERPARLADLSVGVIHHPQSNLSDFYRELGPA